MTTVSTRSRSAKTVACTPPFRAGASKVSPVAHFDRRSAGTRQGGMGQVVHDGPLGFAAIDAFPLYDVCCYAGEYVPAQGLFMYVILDVTNVSNRPQTFVADYQRLVDRNGRIYHPDLRTMSLTAGKYKRRFADLNPGSTARALLLFDVPDGTKETEYRLSLHSSVNPSTASVHLARGA